MTLLMTVPLIFISAVMSGAFSMGGGVLALATFSLVLDPLTLIPFHGFIQFFSNLSRTVISRRNICIKPVIMFAAGTAAGALTGRFFLLKLSPDFMSIIFAAGIIFFT